MKKKKKVLVLTDHMPWGHRAIAKAIYGFLKEKQDGFSVEYAEVFNKSGIWNNSYTFLYRFVPTMNRMAMKLLNTKMAGRMWVDVTRKNHPSLERVIRKSKPDIVISAYLVFSRALADLRQEKKLKFKLWTVVADPWTVVPQSYIKEADLHLVYDQVGLGEGLKRRIPEENLLATGWWTRQEMYKKYNRQKIREKLGFKDDRPVIFVGGGSLGNNILAKILPIMLFVDKKVGFIFNTGTDKMALSLIKEYEVLLKGMGRDKYVQIKSFGWIENMAEMLSACDMVFGKAGPNFLFDCVACQKPFVSVTHIGGQEDGNVELIKEKKLGWVKENPVNLSKFLLKYLKNPSEYQEKYKENILKEAKRNEKSLSIIWRRLKKDWQS